MRTAQTAQTASPTGLLTTNELRAATGATLRQIQWWSDHGHLRQSGRVPSPFPSGAALRGFAPIEAAIARMFLHLSHYPFARRRIAALLRAQRPPLPCLVVADRLGKRIHFASTNAEVLELAKAARGGVIVAEVKA